MTGPHGGAPAPAPCGSCPYRLDVPSGIWAAEEYDKLPRYDGPLWTQPPAAFFCHQQDGRLCAGWVGCHDMDDSFGLRMAELNGLVSEEAATAALNYETSVPLFSSGAEAAAHGRAEIEQPSVKARTVVEKLRSRRP